jgi:hypothetical protein
MVSAVGITVSEPLNAFPPVHSEAPEAVHDVAPVEVHVNVVVASDALPSYTTRRDAVSDTVSSPGSGSGSGAEVTVTVTLSVVVPPAPEHAIEYAVVVVGETDSVPLVAFVPFQPPDAVHELVFVEFQVSAVELPFVIVVDAAERSTVGAAGGGGGCVSRQRPGIKTGTAIPAARIVFSHSVTGPTGILFVALSPLGANGNPGQNADAENGRPVTNKTAATIAARRIVCVPFI